MLQNQINQSFGIKSNEQHFHNTNNMRNDQDTIKKEFSVENV